jgi:hypothetical protein
MNRTEASMLALTAATAFRSMLAQQAQVSIISGSTVSFRVAFKDTVFTGITTLLSVGSVLNSIISQFPGIPLLQITGSGSIKASQETTAETRVAQFDYSDKNIHVATRRFSDGDSYNVVRVYGLVDGVGTAGEVQDDADVIKRGRIVYPPGFVGSPYIDYEEAEALALEGMAAALRGLLDLEIPFNPYLTSGSVIGLSSTRLGITSATAKIYKIRHQYSVGRCRTYLTGLRFY